MSTQEIGPATGTHGISWFQNKSGMNGNMDPNLPKMTTYQRENCINVLSSCSRNCWRRYSSQCPCLSEQEHRTSLNTEFPSTVPCPADHKHSIHVSPGGHEQNDLHWSILRPHKPWWRNHNWKSDKYDVVHGKTNTERCFADLLSRESWKWIKDMLFDFINLRKTYPYILQKQVKCKW